MKRALQNEIKEVIELASKESQSPMASPYLNPIIETLQLMLKPGRNAEQQQRSVGGIARLVTDSISFEESVLLTTAQPKHHSLHA